MPIYEYYCPDNNTIYQFYAKTLAQGKTVPRCPANPKFKLVKLLSSFAVTSGGRKDSGAPGAETVPGAGADDPQMEAAMSAMDREFANVDENDPKAMGRMLRRMAELSGEKVEGQMEEVVRKLEEGADPEALEAELGDGQGADGEDPSMPPGPGGEPKEKRQRFRARTVAPSRDPKLYDYE